ncbi:MAG: DUF7670 domain-containing protein [Anaerolineae bacterium]
MNATIKQVIVWTPRVFGILFAIFISIFALDVFSEGYGFWETLVALFMHLVPTLLVVIALIVAWRWEGIGAALFIALGVAYLVMSRIESWVISGPLLVIGALFLISWIVTRRLER